MSPSVPASAASGTSSGDQTLTKQRNRYTLRLMGKASSGRLPASATEEKPTPRDVFVPPETSIMDYFMIKVSNGKECKPFHCLGGPED